MGTKVDRNRSRRPSRPATLVDLLEKGLDVFCWCNRCGHSAVVGTADLAQRLHPQQPVPALASNLRCSRCGARDAAARPAWPSPGTVARHH